MRPASQVEYGKIAPLKILCHTPYHEKTICKYSVHSYGPDSVIAKGLVFSTPGCSYSGDQLLYMHVGPGRDPIGVLAYAALKAQDCLLMILQTSERQNGSRLHDHADPVSAKEV